MATFSVKMEVLTPKVPNYLRTSHGNTVRVGDLSDEDLVKMAEQWKGDLLKRAKEQRSDKKGST